MDEAKQRTDLLGSTLIPNTRILFGCGVTDQPYMLWDLYFCTKDKILVSSTATIVEPEAQYCPRCLSTASVDSSHSNTPSLLTSSCSRCWICPNCSSDLALTSHPMQQQGSAAVVDRRVFQCGYCMFSSSHVGLTGSNEGSLIVACTNKLRDILEFRSSALSMPGNTNNANNSVNSDLSSDKPRVERAIEMLQKKEAAIKKKNDLQRSRAMTVSSKETNLSKSTQATKATEDEKASEAPSTAPERIDSHHDAIRLRTFSLPPSPSNQAITFCSQRLTQPHQPRFSTMLVPLPRPFVARCLRRCPLCDKQLIRPSNNSNNLRVDRSACFYMPTVSLLQLPSQGSVQRREGAFADLLFLNPRYEAMTVILNPLPSHSAALTNTLSALPEGPFVIAPIPQKGQDQQQQADTTTAPPAAAATNTGAVKQAVILQRHRNTLTLRVPITPKGDFTNGVIVCGFSMSVTYVMETGAGDDKDKDKDKDKDADGKVQVTCPVWLHLGVMAGK